MCLLITTLLSIFLHLYAQIIKFLLHNEFITHLAQRFPNLINLTAAIVKFLKSFIHILFVFNLTSTSLVVNFLVLFLKLHLFAMKFNHLFLLFFKLLAQNILSVDHLLSFLLNLTPKFLFPGPLFENLIFDKLSVLANVSVFDFLFFDLTFKVNLFVLLVDQLCPQITNLGLLHHLFLLNLFEFFLIGCRFDLSKI